MDFTKNNYRKKYLEYFGLDDDKNFDIHHINMDKNNNKIENLLLLPKELHQDYHNRIKQLSSCYQSKDNLSQNATTITIDLTSNQDFIYSLPILNDLKREILLLENWKMLKLLKYDSLNFKIDINKLREEYINDIRFKSL